MGAGVCEGVKGLLVEEGKVEDFSFFQVVEVLASFFLFIGGVLVTRREFLQVLLVGVSGVTVESLAGVIGLVEGLLMPMGYVLQFPACLWIDLEVVQGFSVVGGLVGLLRLDSGGSVVGSGSQGFNSQGFDLTILGSALEFSYNSQESDLTTVLRSIMGSLPSSQGSQGFDLFRVFGLVGEVLLGSQGFDLLRNPQGFDLVGVLEPILGSFLDSARGSTGIGGSAGRSTGLVLRLLVGDSCGSGLIIGSILGSALGSTGIGGSAGGSTGLVLGPPMGDSCRSDLTEFNLIVVLVGRSPRCLLGSIKGSVDKVFGELRV